MGDQRANDTSNFRAAADALTLSFLSLLCHSLLSSLALSFHLLSPYRITYYNRLVHWWQTEASNGCTTCDCLFCMWSQLEPTAEADGNWLHKPVLFIITQINNYGQSFSKWHLWL